MKNDIIADCTKLLELALLSEIYANLNQYRIEKGECNESNSGMIKEYIFQNDFDRGYVEACDDILKIATNLFDDLKK